MKDPKNTQLAQQRQSLFMGETLHGLLLSAWGWGTIATIAGIVLTAIGTILLIVPVMALIGERRRSTTPAARPATPNAAA